MRSSNHTLALILQRFFYFFFTTFTRHPTDRRINQLDRNPTFLYTCTSRALSFSMDSVPSVPELPEEKKSDRPAAAARPTCQFHGERSRRFGLRSATAAIETTICASRSAARPAPLHACRPRPAFRRLAKPQIGHRRRSPVAAAAPPAAMSPPQSFYN